ncbi:MAG: MFS transporter [Actinobacteria bacterium]|nr:MFS transporter [Actinomycetota bacterium]
MSLTVRVFVVTLAVLGGWLAILPGSVETLYRHLDELGTQNVTVTYSLTLGVGWPVFMGALVIGGRLGDRSASSRRTIVISGLAGMALIGGWMFFTTTPVSLIVAWVALQVPVAFVVSSSLALALTHVSQKRRRLVSGLTGTAAVFSIFVGALVLAIFAVPTTVALAGPALVASVLALPLVWLSGKAPAHIANADERPNAPATRIPRRWAALLSSGFLLSCATSITNGYIVVFVSTWMSPSPADPASYVNLVILAATSLSIISGIVVAVLVPSAERARIIYASSAILVAAGIILMALVPEASVVALATAGFGAGFGAANGLELTLVAAMQPSMQRVGLDVGMFTAATTLPYVLIPLVAAGIFSINPTDGIGTLWWIAGNCALAASGVMFFAARPGSQTSRPSRKVVKA